MEGRGGGSLLLRVALGGGLCVLLVVVENVCFLRCVHDVDFGSVRVFRLECKGGQFRFRLVSEGGG